MLPTTTWYWPLACMTLMTLGSSEIASSLAFDSSLSLKRTRVMQCATHLTLDLPPTSSTIWAARSSYLPAMICPLFSKFRQKYPLPRAGTLPAVRNQKELLRLPPGWRLYSLGLRSRSQTVDMHHQIQELLVRAALLELFLEHAVDGVRTLVGLGKIAGGLHKQ